MNSNPTYFDEFVLLESFKNNDLPAFRELYNIYYHQLYNYSYRIIGNQEEVEDILSESFFIIWKKRKEFSSLKSVAAYLYTITRNSCITHLRKAKRRLIAHKALAYNYPTEASVEITDAIKSDLVQWSIIAAQQLPKEMKKVFHLVYIEGFSAAEAAELLQLSIKTINSQKLNAIKRVKETLIKKGLLITF
jgi:RNA polymerase sigma-70 factor (family 1)